MAGLLDIFGTGGTESLGLLGMSSEDMKRARDDAQAQALFSLAGRLFQGGSTGQSIAQGLQMGQQAYKQALQGQLQDKLQTSQLQDTLAKRQEAQAAKQRQAQIQQILGQAYQPAMAGQPAQEMYGEDIMGQRVGEGVTPAVAARPAGFDIQSIAPALMATPEGRAELSNLIKTQEMMQPKLTTLKPEEQLGYMRDGQFVTVAQGAPKPQEPVKPPSAVQEYEYAKSQGYKGSFEQFKQLNKPVTTTTVNVGDKSFAAEFGKGVAQSVENTFNAAQGAVGTLSRIQTLKPLVSDNAVFSGPLANAQVTVSRIAESLGVGGANNSEKLKNTAVAMQQLAGLELNAAEAMKGQGAITENERALIKRAAGGDLMTMTSSEVSSLIGALEKTSKFKIQAHERNIGRLSSNPATAQLAEYYALPTIQEAPKSNMPSKSGPASPLKFDAAKENRYQEWLKTQGK